MSLTTLDRLDDHTLTVELGRLAGCEREATAALVAHLAEFDARRLYEGEGFSSLFKYGTTILRLSEDSAYNRIQAARAVQRYPAILDRLASGALSVTTVRLLAPHLTPENHQTLLAAAEGKGKRDVEQLLATWFPQPDVPPSVRRLPVRTGGPAVPSEATIGDRSPATSVPPSAGVATVPVRANDSCRYATTQSRGAGPYPASGRPPPGRRAL